MIDPLSTAIILAIFSAICSAGLNITMKQAKNKLAMRTMVAWYAALYCLPMTPFVPFPSSYGVIILVISSAIHFSYNLCQIKSLEAIDVSISYPITRGLSPLLVALGSILLFDEQIGLYGFLGIILIAISILCLVNFQSLFSGSKEFKNGILWSICAGACVAAYTLTDSHGARSEENFLSFILWFFIFDIIGVSLLFFIKNRNNHYTVIKQEASRAFAGSLLYISTYGFSIYAFVLAEGHTAMIASIRETSIIFGMVMAYFLLKERFHIKRLISAFGIFTGILILKFM